MDFPAYIYMFTHKATGKKYIGRSSNPTQRYKHHLFLLKSGTHPVEELQKDFNEYGNQLCFEILETINTFEDRYREHYWQVYYKTNDRRFGYNYKDKAVKIAADNKQKEFTPKSELQRRRFECGYSMTDFAKKLGFKKERWWKYEKDSTGENKPIINNVTANLVYRVAKYLNCEMTEIFDFKKGVFK